MAFVTAAFVRSFGAVSGVVMDSQVPLLSHEAAV